MTLAFLRTYTWVRPLCSPVLLFLPLSLSFNLFLFPSLSLFFFSPSVSSTFFSFLSCCTPFSVSADRFDQRCLRSRRMRDDQWGINAFETREILVRVSRTPIERAYAHGCRLRKRKKTHTRLESSVLHWRRLYWPGYLTRSALGTLILFL